MQKYIIFHYISAKTKYNENEKKIPCIFLYFLLGFWFLFFLGDFENIFSEIAEKDAEKNKKKQERWKRNWFGKMEKFLNVIISVSFFAAYISVNPLDPICLNPYALCFSTRLHFSVHRENSLRLIEPLILIFYATLPMLSCSLIYMFVIAFNFEWK